MHKLSVPYEHNSADLSQVWLAISNGTPAEADWKAAFRDTDLDGMPIVWVKYEQVPQGNLWIRDRAGVRMLDRPW